MVETDAWHRENKRIVSSTESDSFMILSSRQGLLATELHSLCTMGIESGWDLRALEETTKNITIQLTSLGLDRKLKDDVTHILNFSDMVKFAKQKGVFSQHENALNILKETLETHSEHIG